jgi:dTDP-4-dehydrorhamnose reductase
MKLVLLGKEGQVGWELQRALAPLGELVALGQDEADFTDADALVARVRAERPDVVVNAAAYTAVDKAESDAAVAAKINAEAPAALARLCAELGAWMVHYSTDYVYDGRAVEPYVESAPTNPLSVYGRTKLAGDLGIADAGCKHLIFRTSWVFAARGGNFAKTMLRLAGERETLNVVADQFGAPTSAELIADVTALCLHRVAGNAGGEQLSGTYHLVAAGEASWCDYARHVIAGAARRGAVLKATADAVKPIPTSAYPLPAVRPANSRLSVRKLESAFGLSMPDWRRHVDRMLDEIVG